MTTGMNVFAGQEPLETASHIKYTALPGLFLQDDAATDPKGFDYATSNLGLIERGYPTDEDFDPERTKTQWQRFEHYIRQLQSTREDDVQYKVLYLARHGEGVHNVAEAFYGTEAWDCYWSLLDGNDTVTWADARLTEKGIDQARRAHQFWKTKLSLEKIPAPESYYVSPLDRCLSTANHTFSGLTLPTPFRPTVKELLREALGLHTCDRRSNAAYIRSAYPLYTLEPGFAEDDPLWNAELRESNSALQYRMKTLLDDIFSTDSSTFVSLTSHSGAITQMLNVLGHRPFGVQTGGIIPVMVEARIIRRPPPDFEIEPGTPAPPCTGNPATMRWVPN